MKLLDSNIIIYSAKDNYAFLRKIYKERNVFISDITRLEVLGFHRITPNQEEFFISIFSVVNILPLSNEVIEAAIKLRRTYNLFIGDSLISTTSILKNLILYTNNEADIVNIKGLKIHNPLKDKIERIGHGKKI